MLPFTIWNNCGLNRRAQHQWNNRPLKIENHVRLWYHFEKKRCQVAVTFMWLNTARLFLWGYVKSPICANKLATIEWLKANVERVKKSNENLDIIITWYTLRNIYLKLISSYCSISYQVLRQSIFGFNYGIVIVKVSIIAEEIAAHTLDFKRIFFILFFFLDFPQLFCMTLMILNCFHTELHVLIHIKIYMNTVVNDCCR